MKRILIGIGISMLGKWLLEALNPAELLEVHFPILERPKGTLFNWEIPVKLDVTNNNPYSIDIAAVSGVLVYGTIRVPVQHNVNFTLTNGQKMRAGFTAIINSGDLLIQASREIELGRKSELRFLGNIAGAIEGKTFSVGINKIIPLR